MADTFDGFMGLPGVYGSGRLMRGIYDHYYGGGQEGKSGQPQGGQGGQPRQVETFDVSPEDSPTFGMQQPQQGQQRQAAAIPPQIPQQSGGGRQELLDLYKQRMQQMGEEPEESTQEKIGRMLVNFGRGATAGATNISGRKVGPSGLESISTGAAALGKGEQEESRRQEELGAERQEDVTSMLEQMIGYHGDIEEAQADRAERAFDRWATKRELEIDEKRSHDNLTDYLVGRLAPRLVASGTRPDEVIPKITQIMDAISKNPELARRFGLD